MPIFFLYALIAHAQELLPTTKYLLKDQYREEHWGVDLAAVVAKNRRGGGVLQGAAPRRPACRRHCEAPPDPIPRPQAHRPPPDSDQLLLNS